ncbi:hypothetical protein [Cohnella herbarum]|uniref:Uncharacterized protein n=1 Tax=Cohnella herbarum TaxID=2728023 RepID=A0A7Z2ZMV2_9BACL|nr:hypothetical protein [Cohnella herbarum]QJD85369.1 hypothetical protein HH215_20780 [Cohnella herbarum]
MKKSTRFLTAFALICALMAPSLAYAAEESKETAPPEVKPIEATLTKEGGFAALQIGKQVFVYNKDGQLFQTKGKERIGELKDLFVIPYGPEKIPMILIKNDKNGYMVFSDLWPKIVPGKEKDTTDAYYSGRIHTSARDKVVTRTGHHYAEKIGDEVVAYTANDFDDLKKGFHESIRVKGELRGLILYDCCPYLVVDDGKETLSVYHAGENGPELASSIEFK